MGKYLDPFVDFGFKFIFGREESKELLIHFLNALLCDEPGFSPIVDLSYLDKESPKPDRESKGIIYDIHCRTSNGNRFIVEMQNKSQTFFFDRIIYYSASAIGAQMHSGDGFGNSFMPVYCICFMNFILEKEPDDFKIDAAICNMRTGKPISNKLRYVFIQTPLFDKKTEEECVTFFDKWMFNIINMAKMGTVAFTKENEIFQKLADVASFASLTESERVAYIKDLKAYSDMHGQLDYAREEGFDKGVAFGFDKGVAEERQNTIQSMIGQGFGLDVIANIYKMAVADVKKILNKE